MRASATEAKVCLNVDPKVDIRMSLSKKILATSASFQQMPSMYCTSHCMVALVTNRLEKCN